MKDWIPEYFSACPDGVSSALPPEMLPATQVAWGRNITTRGGRPHTRPAIRQLGYLPSGRFQGIGYFSKAGGLLVTSIAGRLYRVSLSRDGFLTSPIEMGGFDNSPAQRRVWFCETPSALIVQDDQSRALFYDGARGRRSARSNDEVPIGSHMAYANGRLWTAIEGGTKLVAGDIYDEAVAGSELRVTETNFLLGGGTYSFPQGITGLAFMPQIDTTTAYGALVVGSWGVVSSIHAEITARDTWQSTQGFETIVFPEVGALGGFVAINQDLYWRSADGAIRSFRQAVADMSGPGNAPISREVGRILDYDAPELLESGSAIYFGNRLLVTCAPYFDGRGNVVHDRVVSLDFAPIATMRGKSAPAFDGEWTGLGVRQLIVGVFDRRRRAFAVMADSEGRNILAEITEDGRQDRTLAPIGAAIQTKDHPVEASIETRAYSFGDITRLKRLERLDLFVSDVRERVFVWIFWRADFQSEWKEWDAFAFEPPPPSGKSVWKKRSPGYATQAKTLTIPDIMEGETFAHIGCTFQLKLETKGQCQVGFRLFASPLPEQTYAGRASGGGYYIDQDGNPYTDQEGNTYIAKS